MGVSGSGKSTVGAALARRLHVPFVDADTLHPPANIAKMTAGEPLNDDDRYPWLETVGAWLADHRGGGVVSCSALKRKYRDQLRAHCPGLRSQFDALEPLGADEAGVTADAGQAVDAIVDDFAAGTGV
jgi:gluconokinase